VRLAKAHLREIIYFFSITLARCAEIGKTRSRRLDDAILENPPLHYLKEVQTILTKVDLSMSVTAEMKRK
jgi:hypothetical protein